jgi:hypothetical protein
MAMCSDIPQGLTAFACIQGILQQKQRHVHTVWRPWHCSLGAVLALRGAVLLCREEAEKLKQLHAQKADSW